MMSNVLRYLFATASVVALLMIVVVVEVVVAMFAYMYLALTHIETFGYLVGVSVTLGIALLPALYVRSEIPKVTNVVLGKVPGAKPGRTIALVWRKSSPQGADYHGLARSLREFVQKKFAGIVQVSA